MFPYKIPKDENEKSSPAKMPITHIIDHNGMINLRLLLLLVHPCRRQQGVLFLFEEMVICIILNYFSFIEIRILFSEYA